MERVKANAQNQAHLQTAQADTQTKVCKRACFSSDPKRISKFFLLPSKKLKHPELISTLDKYLEGFKTNQTINTHGHEQEGHLPTAVLQKWRCSASYDSFVVGSSSVLRMKFSGENRHLRKAAKRYAAF